MQVFRENTFGREGAACRPAYHGVGTDCRDNRGHELDSLTAAIRTTPSEI